MTCKHFGSCGGCVSQHIPYEVQVENKRARMAGLLQKMGFPGEVASCCSRPFGYRNRMDFIFHPGGLGLRRQGDWRRIVDIDDCPIANGRVNALLKEVRAWFVQNKDSLVAFDVKRQEGTFKYCLIRACEFSDDAALSFVMNGESGDLAGAVGLVRGFASQTSAKNVIVTYVPRKSDVSVGDDCFAVKGVRFLEERMGGFTFRYDVQGFFQNNPAVALEMVGYARDRILLQQEGRVLLQGGKGVGEGINVRRGIEGKGVLLDLFGGVGLFGISLAHLAGEVVIVESSREGICCAEKNLSANSVKGRGVCMDAKGIAKLCLVPDIVIADPPRTGMPSQATAWLLKRLPAGFVYVSCNPVELVNDITRLSAEYSIAGARIFDMFPQTNHVETIVDLKRK